MEIEILWDIPINDDQETEKDYLLADCQVLRKQPDVGIMYDCVEIIDVTLPKHLESNVSALCERELLLDRMSLEHDILVDKIIAETGV